MEPKAAQACPTLPAQALERIVVEAMEDVLGRFPREHRAAALRALRRELEQCLAETPSGDAPVIEMGLRARLAAAIAGAC